MTLEAIDHVVNCLGYRWYVRRAAYFRCASSRRLRSRHALPCILSELVASLNACTYIQYSYAKAAPGRDTLKKVTKYCELETMTGVNFSHYIPLV